MNLRLSQVLGGVCVALAILFTYQLLAPVPAYSVPDVRAAAAPALPAGAPPFVAPSNAEFAAISERPLFDVQRKKYVPPILPAVNKSAPPPPPSLSLVGVIIDSDHRMAMVKSSEGALASSVAVGADVGGWKVDTIEPDRIVLKAGTAQDEIRLDTNKAPPQSAPPLQAQAPQQQSAPQAPQQQNAQQHTP